MEERQPFPPSILQCPPLSARKFPRLSRRSVHRAILHKKRVRPNAGRGIRIMPLCIKKILIENCTIVIKITKLQKSLYIIIYTVEEADKNEIRMVKIGQYLLFYFIFIAIHLTFFCKIMLKLTNF